LQFTKIKYSELNAKQKECFNFHKISGVLADYGFNCIKLSDDWLGADFLAYHLKTGETLKVQLKGRLTIDKKYVNKDLWITFPFDENWYLIKHDNLVSLSEKHTNYLTTKSWCDGGCYSVKNLSKDMISILEEYKL
jgi:hypothetical protein